MPAGGHVPVSEPVIGYPEIVAVNDALRSGWISSSGPYLDAFEEDWSSYCNRRHGVAVSNGTTALELAVAALGLKEGDEVIMPSFTIISCALAVVRSGATPVLVDCDPGTWCMDTAQIEARITDRTRAIMPVHIYGHPCDMNAILELALGHDLRICEDAAEAHGAECVVNDRWRRCGSFGDVSTFSFYANKLITTGEGGMIVTNDDRIAAELRSARNLGFRPEQRFLHTELAHQYRFTNLQAAFGVSQIARIPELLERKRSIARAYTAGLSGIPGLQLPVAKQWARPMYWMYGVVLDDDVAFDAREFAKRLDALGIETRPFFLGMHEQPALRDLGLFAGENYPVAERIARRGLYLPSGLGLSEEQIDRVVTAVRTVLR